MLEANGKNNKKQICQLPRLLGVRTSGTGQAPPTTRVISEMCSAGTPTRRALSTTDGDMLKWKKKLKASQGRAL